MANITEDSEASESKSESDTEEISLAAKQKHQSWYLHSGCSRHMTGRRHMFQSLELKPGGHVGFGGNQRAKSQLRELPLLFYSAGSDGILVTFFN